MTASRSFRSPSSSSYLKASKWTTSLRPHLVLPPLILLMNPGWLICLFSCDDYSCERLEERQPTQSNSIIPFLFSGQEKLFRGKKQIFKKVRPEIQFVRPEHKSEARELLAVFVQGKAVKIKHTYNKSLVAEVNFTLFSPVM